MCVTQRQKLLFQASVPLIHHLKSPPQEGYQCDTQNLQVRVSTEASGRKASPSVVRRALG